MAEDQPALTGMHATEEENQSFAINLPTEGTRIQPNAGFIPWQPGVGQPIPGQSTLGPTMAGQPYQWVPVPVQPNPWYYGPSPSAPWPRA